MDGNIIASSDKSDAITGENITINGGNITAKGGEYGGAICVSNELIINGGNINAKANNRWASSTLGGNSERVVINGGTIVTNSAQLAGISCNSNGIIAINGGNIFSKGKEFSTAKCIDTRYNIENLIPISTAKEVYVTPIKLQDVSGNKKIQSLTTSDNIDYGTKDMYTFEDDESTSVDETGMIYLYLPLGERAITINVDGQSYSGTVETKEEVSEVITLNKI